MDLSISCTTRLATCWPRTADGVFVVECAVPTAVARAGRQMVDAEQVGVDYVVLDVCRYDPVSQVLDESDVQIAPGGITLAPMRVRLADLRLKYP